MTTRFVGIKEFRQNMAKLSNKMLRNNERLIVLRKNKPLIELRPIQKQEKLFEFYKEIEDARASARAGNVYTQDEVRKMLGL